jgi:hypothetical protein
MSKNDNDVCPQRLTFISMGQNCMFCQDPQGASYSTFVALEAKVGYISCGDCRENMGKAAEFWRTHRAFGKANYLKDRTDLKILRSNGDIEAGWRLNNPMVNINSEGLETISLCNDEKHLEKICFMESILELNP